MGDSVGIVNEPDSRIFDLPEAAAFTAITLAIRSGLGLVARVCAKQYHVFGIPVGWVPARAEQGPDMIRLPVAVDIEMDPLTGRADSMVSKEHELAHACGIGAQLIMRVADRAAERLAAIDASVCVLDVKSAPRAYASRCFE